MYPGVSCYYMFVCLGCGWVGYFTFLLSFGFLKTSVLCTCNSMLRVPLLYKQTG